MCNKVVFSLESKMALFTFERYFGSSEASKPHFNVLLSLLYVCPKDVFLDKPKIAFFAFKICTDEYILCSFGLCVTKLNFHLNLTWHCLHLKGIQGPLKPLSLIQNLLLSFLYVCPNE